MNSPKCNLHHFFQGTVVNLAYPFNWKVTWNFNIKKNNNYICTIIGSSKIVCSLKYSKKNLKNAKCQFQFRRKRCMTEIFYENFQIFLRYNKLKLFPIPILTFYNCWFSRRKFSRIFFPHSNLWIFKNLNSRQLFYLPAIYLTDRFSRFHVYWIQTRPTNLNIIHL